MSGKQPPTYPLFRILDSQGRRLDWLAAKIDYDLAHCSRVKWMKLPATRTFRLRCAEALDIPEDILFATPGPPEIVPDEEPDHV